MIKLYEQVTHNGKTYEPNEEIDAKEISQKEAERLVNLEVAFFVGKITEDVELNEKEEIQDDQEDIVEEFEEEISDEEYQSLYKQLDNAFNAEPLQKFAKEHGVDWEGNKKENVIEAIILQDKVEQILAEKE
ncbi:hypothetical protein ACGTN6_20920 [Halomonas sp. THAF12]|uniref:hypothetical protein n=1 Tax=Halomonas sp. B23F22_10 TaxID=3459515 RepID=UPI00373F4385